MRKKDSLKENKNIERSTAFHVKLWGVRGSLPTPRVPESIEAHIRSIMNDFAAVKKTKKTGLDPETFLKSLPRHLFGGYGGNTPCAEIKSKNQQIIIDGGSGIRTLGYELMKGPCGRGQGEVHIFFTHFHWDHLIGLPFFTPIFIPGNKIHVYSVQHHLKQVFQDLFKKPYFPVPLENLGATLLYHQLEPRKPLQLGDLSMTPYQLDHPDPCWGYKVECQGKVYSHCVDTECTRVSRKELGLDLPLYQGVDIMLFDAQYTLMESIERVNWGHATALLGLDIAMREKIKKVIFVHFDPAASPEKIAKAESQAREYYNDQIKRAQDGGNPLHPVDWEFGFEGMILDV